MRRLFLSLPFLLLLAVSFSGSVSGEQSPWHLRLSLPSGEISDAVFASQNDVWAVGPAGVFLSGDSGKSWQFVDAGHSLSAVDAAPGGVYGWAVTDTGIIMATADSGRTWSYQQSGTAINLVDVDAVSNKIAYLFGRGRGLGGDFDENPRILLKTADGGQTWSEVKLDPGYKLESMDFLDDGRHGWLSVTVLGGHALLKTSDGGASWITVNSEGERYFDQMQFLTPDMGWARAVVRRPSYMNSHILMRTLNGGATWQEVLTLDIGLEPGQFYAFDDKSAVATDADRNIVRTNDGGSTWSAVLQGEHGPTEVLTAWDESHGVRVRAPIDYSAGPVTWTDDHRTWQAASMPITTGHGFEFLDGKLGWVAASRLLHTADGGLTWQTASDKFFLSVDFISPNEGWGLLGPGFNTPLVHTNDGGATWEQLVDELSNMGELAFFDSNSGWMSGGPWMHSWPWRTDDGGHTWKGGGSFGGRFFVFVESQVAWSVHPPELHLSSAQAPVLNGSMYVEVTSDGGKTVHSSSFETLGFCGGPAVAAVDAQRAWVFWQKCEGTRTASEVEMTVDGGETWETLSSLPLQDIFNAKFFDSSRGIAAGLQCDDQGQCQEVLLHTGDGGASWTAEMTGILTNRAENVEYQFLDPQHIWRVGWRTSAAVEEIYSYDVSAAPPSSIIMPVTDLGPESSAGGAPPSSIIMPPTGSGLESSTSGALYAAFLAAMIGVATLALGARLRRRSR